MKKITLLSALSTVILLANEANLQQYDLIFDSINETRVGLKGEDISSLKNPFIKDRISSNNTVETNSKEDNKTIAYNLYAIFDDKAKINNSWYKKGDNVGIYKLIKVKPSSVILKAEDYKKELKLIRGKDNVTISY